MCRSLGHFGSVLFLILASSIPALAQVRGVNASDPHLYGAGPASGFQIFNPNYRTPAYRPGGVGLSPTGYNASYVTPGYNQGYNYAYGNPNPGLYNYGYGPGYGFGYGYGPTPYGGGFNGVGISAFPVPFAVPGYAGTGYVGLPSYGVTYGRNVTGFGVSGYSSFASQTGAFGIPFNRGYYRRGYSTGVNFGNGAFFP